MKQDKETRIARVFRNGRNQAVRLPKDYHIDAEEVYLRQEGQNIMLIPKPRSWDSYFANSRCLTDDFPDRIEDLPPQEREQL